MIREDEWTLLEFMKLLRVTGYRHPESIDWTLIEQIIRTRSARNCARIYGLAYELHIRRNYCDKHELFADILKYGTEEQTEEQFMGAEYDSFLVHW